MTAVDRFYISFDAPGILCVGSRELADGGDTEGINLSRGATGAVSRGSCGESSLSGMR